MNNEVLSERWTARIDALLKFIHEETPHALLAVQEKPQYTHLHRQMKRKGGNPPRDYRVAEMVCDLERMLKNPSPMQTGSIISLYYQITRLLGIS